MKYDVILGGCLLPAQRSDFAFACLAKCLASLDLLRFGSEECNVSGTVIVIIFSHQLIRAVGKEKQGLPQVKSLCGDTTRPVAGATSFQPYLRN